jgi:hypothetical protein
MSREIVVTIKVSKAGRKPMTMRPSGQEGVTIKGLAKLFNR